MEMEIFELRPANEIFEVGCGSLRGDLDRQPKKWSLMSTATWPGLAVIPKHHKEMIGTTVQTIFV